MFVRVYFRFIVSKSRATSIISLVWLVSFLICMPFIIIHWPQEESIAPVGSTMVRNSNITTDQICTQMNNSPTYIMYSAFGSFYIPMIVICYYYSRIYCTVRKVASSAQTGIVSMSLVSSPAMLLADMCTSALVKAQQPPTTSVAQRAIKTQVKKTNSTTLRIHKGGYKPVNAQNGGGSNTLLASPQLDPRKISDSTATGNSYDTTQTPRTMTFNPRDAALRLLSKHLLLINSFINHVIGAIAFQEIC